MWKCPVCSGEKKESYKCINCGFDERRDFIGLRTVCPVTLEDYGACLHLFIKKIIKENTELKKQVCELSVKVSAMETEKETKIEKVTETFTSEELSLIMPMREQAARAKKTYQKYKSSIKNIYVTKSVKKSYVDGNYEGTMNAGCREGYGVMHYTNGMVYEGQWRSDKKTGYGSEKRASGYTYEGEFFRDQKQGYGICRYVDGSIYEGYFENGLKWGYGKETYINGVVYEGFYQEGKLNGYGICTYANGVVYKGKWVNGLKDGRGIEIYSDGSVYSGYWQCGRRTL